MLFKLEEGDNNTRVNLMIKGDENEWFGSVIFLIQRQKPK